MTNAELIKALREVANWIVAMSYNSEYAHDELKMLHYEDSIRTAADALEAADKRIAELSLDNKMLKNTIDADKGVMLDQIRFLETQLPKECEFKRHADKIPNARNRYCTQCGAYLSDEEFENHTVRYCYWCGSKVKGEQE